MVGFYGGAPLEYEAINQQGSDAVPSSTGPVLGAAFDGGPGATIPRLMRSTGRLAAETGLLAVDEYGRQIMGEPDEQLDPESANQQFGIKGALSFDKPVAKSVAQDLYEHKREQIERDDTITRRAGGIFQGGVARFTASMAAGLLDPVNLAVGLIPVVGEARVASLLGRGAIEAASVAERAGVRAVAGGVSGAAQMAALQPLEFALSKQEHEDYTMADALRSIALGTVLGGGLHAGTGALLDRATGLYRNPVTQRLEDAGPEARETLLQGALAQTVDGRLVDIAPALDGIEAAKVNDRPVSAGAADEIAAAARQEPAPEAAVRAEADRAAVQPSDTLQAVQAEIAELEKLKAPVAEEPDAARPAGEAPAAMPDLAAEAAESRASAIERAAACITRA